MAPLKNILIAALVLSTTPLTVAQNACIRQYSIEIDGSHQIPSEISWNEQLSPDQFIVDIKKIPRIKKNDIEKFAQKFQFKHPESIFRAFINSNSEASAVYNTEINPILATKIFPGRLGGHLCMPASSINGEIKAMPASINFIRFESKKKCMWHITVLDQHNSILHTFYHPINCDQAPTKASLSRLVDIIEDLI